MPTLPVVAVTPEAVPPMPVAALAKVVAGLSSETPIQTCLSKSLTIRTWG